jgi:hypothetical protein
MVPACPDWSLKDLIAHLQHVSVAYAAGRHEYSTQDAVAFAVAWSVDRRGVDEWAQRGVDARRERSLDGLLDDWADASVVASTEHGVDHGDECEDERPADRSRRGDTGPLADRPPRRHAGAGDRVRIAPSRSRCGA